MQPVSLNVKCFSDLREKQVGRSEAAEEEWSFQPSGFNIQVRTGVKSKNLAWASLLGLPQPREGVFWLSRDLTMAQFSIVRSRLGAERAVGGDAQALGAPSTGGTAPTGVRNGGWFTGDTEAWGRGGSCVKPVKEIPQQWGAASHVKGRKAQGTSIFCLGNPGRGALCPCFSLKGQNKGQRALGKKVLQRKPSSTHPGTPSPGCRAFRVRRIRVKRRICQGGPNTDEFWFLKYW